MARYSNVRWVYLLGRWELQQLTENQWVRLGVFTSHQKTLIDGLILSLTSTGSVRYLENNSEAEYIIRRAV